MSKPLVCYSLALGKSGPYLDQLLRSIASLRRHNTNIHVMVMVYGDLPEAATRRLKSCDAEVRQGDDYAECLRRLSAEWEALSSYPVLPKYLSMAELAETEVSQFLHLDCDTFLLDDVAKLFARYQQHEWYGREEVYSRLSPWFDAKYIDPLALSELVKTEGLREVPTLNMGVLMLNRGLHREAGKLLGPVLDYVCRFMAWVAEHRDLYERVPFAAPQGCGSGKPLPYPSSNLWIMDEIAFWLAMGRLREISWGTIAWEDFLQGQEFLAAGRESSQAIGCHYFSVNQALFSDWLGEPVETPEASAEHRSPSE